MKQPWRVRVAMGLYIACLQVLAKLTQWIVGSEHAHDGMSGLMGLLRSQLAQREEAMVGNGRAREHGEISAMVSRLAATVRPESTWNFHKDTWGDAEVIVLPRVIDSNTGVILGPPGHPALGAVVTNDGNLANCEPAALAQIVGPEAARACVPMVETQTTAHESTQAVNAPSEVRP